MKEKQSRQTCLNTRDTLLSKKSLFCKKKKKEETSCRVAICIIYRLRMTNRCLKLRNLMTNIETGKYSEISDVDTAIRELAIIFQALPSVPSHAQVF